MGFVIRCLKNKKNIADSEAEIGYILSSPHIRKNSHGIICIFLQRL